MEPQHPLDPAVTEFGQALRLLVRRLRTVSGARDFSWTQSAVMARLAKDGPATTAELARAEGIKPQSMRTIIAALEERGLVARRPHPTDGRQIPLELTATGMAMRQRILEAKWAWLAQAIARLSPTERDTLLAASRIIKQLGEW